MYARILYLITCCYCYYYYYTCIYTQIEFFGQIKKLFQLTLGFFSEVGCCCKTIPGYHYQILYIYSFLLLKKYWSILSDSKWAVQMTYFWIQACENWVICSYAQIKSIVPLQTALVWCEDKVFSKIEFCWLPQATGWGRDNLVAIMSTCSLSDWLNESCSPKFSVVFTFYLKFI